MGPDWLAWEKESDIDERICPGRGVDVFHDARLQLSSDLSSADSDQISPCNPRRHLVASQQSEVDWYSVKRKHGLAQMN